MHQLVIQHRLHDSAVWVHRDPNDAVHRVIAASELTSFEKVADDHRDVSEAKALENLTQLFTRIFTRLLAGIVIVHLLLRHRLTKQSDIHRRWLRLLTKRNSRNAGLDSSPGHKLSAARRCWRSCPSNHFGRGCWKWRWDFGELTLNRLGCDGRGLDNLRRDLFACEGDNGSGLREGATRLNLTALGFSQLNARIAAITQGLTESPSRVLNRVIVNDRIEELLPLGLGLTDRRCLTHEGRALEGAFTLQTCALSIRPGGLIRRLLLSEGAVLLKSLLDRRRLDSRCLDARRSCRARAGELNAVIIDDALGLVDLSLTLRLRRFGHAAGSQRIHTRLNDVLRRHRIACLERRCYVIRQRNNTTSRLRALRRSTCHTHAFCNCRTVNCRGGSGRLGLRCGLICRRRCLQLVEISFLHLKRAASIITHGDVTSLIRLRQLINGARDWIRRIFSVRIGDRRGADRLSASCRRRRGRRGGFATLQEALNSASARTEPSAANHAQSARGQYALTDWGLSCRAKLGNVLGQLSPSLFDELLRGFASCRPSGTANDARSQSFG